MQDNFGLTIKELWARVTETACHVKILAEAAGH
jgi:hypothetical protein